MNKLENVQRCITRFICYKLGQNNLIYIDRLKCLDLLPLSTRRDMKIIKLINRIIVNENIPENWINNLVFKRTSRNGNTLEIPKTRINICDRNIFIHAAKLYNKLPINLRMSDNFLLNIKQTETYLYNSFIENFV